MCKTCIIGYDESGFLWSASVWFVCHAYKIREMHTKQFIFLRTPIFLKSNMFSFMPSLEYTFYPSSAFSSQSCTLS